MKFKNIFIMGLSVLGFTSCTDFLDVEAPSKFDNDYIFSSKEEMNVLLNSIYTQLLDGSTYGGDYYIARFCLNSDVDMSTSTSDMATDNSYRRFDCTSNGSEIEKLWNASYEGIEYCNNFIYNAENSEFANDSEVLQMIGEAKVIRAMFYHDMVVLFGDIPFSFTPSIQVENQVMPVMSREEIYNHLIEDLEQAAPNMMFANQLSEGVERVSKEFCWSMIARIALSCGGYSLHPDELNPASYGVMKRPDNYKDYYDICRIYCDSVISSNTHDLQKEFYQVFYDECNYKVTNNDDPIFEIPFAQNQSGGIGYYHGPKGNMWNSATTGNNVWGGSSGNARVSAFYRYMFHEKDKRRDYLNGMWYYEYDGTPLINSDYTVFNNKWSKFWTESPLGNMTEGNTGINFPYMRYTDVLLMYAEAVNEVEDGVSGPNGAKAIEQLRKVRSRAFDDQTLVDSYIKTVAASKETFLKAVLDERKFEFAGENMRWKDLVRNNLYNEVVYYSFYRYFSVAENASGSPQFLEQVSEYDGIDYEKLPTMMYWKEVENSNDITKYPNKVLNVLDIYNPYERVNNPPSDDYEGEEFYQWWDDFTPKAQCMYSFYGYIRCDLNGNIWLVNSDGSLLPDGGPVSGGMNTLPVIRYILPYPQSAIQRSAGEYKNYYGYKN